MNPGFHGVRAHWNPGFIAFGDGGERERAVRAGLEERWG